MTRQLCPDRVGEVGHEQQREWAQRQDLHGDRVHAGSVREEHDSSGHRRGIERRRSLRRPGDHHTRTRAVSAGRLSIDEEHVLAGAPSGGHWARGPDARAVRVEAPDHGRARAAWPRSSRLAAFQLRLGPRLVLRAVALRLHPRLALGGRSLPPWLGARWLGALLTRRLRGTSPWGGLGRGVGLAASLAGAVPVTLVALAAGAGPRPRLRVGRCDDAGALRIATARVDLAPLVVVQG